MAFIGLVIKNADGKPEYLACIAHDTTGRRRIEESLRAALAAEKELNLFKSNFVAIASHEFRTPLGIIQSSAELLQNYVDRLTLERRDKLVGAIVSATEEMSLMMEDVLLLSHIESARYEFQPCQLSLDELCQRLADEIASATHGLCPIQVQCGPLPELAWCDEGLLRHIFINLLSNAVKYSPAGAPVYFRADKDHHEAVFIVQDHGMGIPPEDQPQLFQAFLRGRNVSDIPGTGLGLVIVKRCVTLLGGTVSIESALGTGTVVTIRLPLFAGQETGNPNLRRRRELVAHTGA